MKKKGFDLQVGGGFYDFIFCTAGIHFFHFLLHAFITVFYIRENRFCMVDKKGHSKAAIHKRTYQLGLNRVIMLEA